MLEKERKEFVEAVHSAFAGTEYPGDDDLVADKSLIYDDSQTTFNSFRGKHWQEVSLDTLSLNRDHLPFFTPKAYRFYLPAYLIATILHFETIDVAEFTMYSLIPVSPEKAWYAHFNERVSGFDPPQRKVISQFLALYAQLDPYPLIYNLDDDLQSAIDYWG